MSFSEFTSDFDMKYEKFSISVFLSYVVIHASFATGCFYGPKEIQRRFPVDVQTPQNAHVFWDHSHSCYLILIPESYCWRHLY